VKLFVSDKCLGLVENLAEFYPEASWQRCVVHFYRNVWTAVPTGKVKEVAAMLKAVHAQEDAQAAREKAAQVVEKLKATKLARAADGRSRRGRNVELLRDAVGALALDQDQQPAGAADAGDSTTNACGGRLPGWQVGTDAGGRSPTICRCYQVGYEALSADEPAGRRRGHRLTPCSGPHGDQNKSTNPTTFLSAN